MVRHNIHHTKGCLDVVKRAEICSRVQRVLYHGRKEAPVVTSDAFSSVNEGCGLAKAQELVMLVLRLGKYFIKGFRLMGLVNWLVNGTDLHGGLDDL